MYQQRYSGEGNRLSLTCQTIYDVNILETVELLRVKMKTGDAGVIDPHESILPGNGRFEEKYESCPGRSFSCRPAVKFKLFG
jgi:hypothetical protein